MEHGGLSAMISGAPLMPLLFAGNLVLIQEVCRNHLYTYTHFIASYGTATSAPCCARYGQGSGQIVLDNVGCTGTEMNIFDCPSNGINQHNCIHAEDAGAVCEGESLTV